MIRERLEAFLFPAKASTWITILRTGLGLQVTAYTLSLWHDWNSLFAATSDGLIRRDLMEAILSLDSSALPRLGWLVILGQQIGLAEETTLRLASGCLLVSGFCLLIGFLSRPAAIIAWLLHLAARGSSGWSTYGMDTFMTIGLFYLLISPLPDRSSIDGLLWNKKPANPHRSGFHLRVLQLHLCVIYFFGGLTKCLGTGWWNGASMWRSLIRSPFNIISPDFLLKWSYLLPFVGICICLLEIGYPILVWPKRIRKIWVPCILAMHAAIGLTMGLYLFALIMIVLNVAAFGADSISIPFRKGKPGALSEPRSKGDEAVALM